MALLMRRKLRKLSDLLDLIDPTGDLIPGGVEHNVIVETITKWIEEMGPEKAEQKVRASLEHLQRQVKTMDMLR